MAQKYTSARTSINGKQGRLPALYTSITFPVGRVVDYGCGDAPDQMKQKAESDGAEWFGYDKYNQVQEINDKTLNVLYNGVDLSVACNLLNVIDDDDEVKRIIKEMVSNSAESIFQVYEGDRTNVGRATGDDQYQRNAKRSWYEGLIRSMGYEITKTKGNMIFVKGEKINEESC